MARETRPRPDTQAMIQGIVSRVVDAGYDAHRLAYVHYDEDNPLPNGKPSQLFVCKCQEAFDRSSYNEHIRDSYKEVG